jgi:pyrroloquinoline quinone (PQQ) biosynthesis protein C
LTTNALNRTRFGADFIKRISDEALESAAVNHPYLQAMRQGTFPNVRLALQDFAVQYGIYSNQFICCLSAVIENLHTAEHKQILQSNLSEENGSSHDSELPPDVLESVAGQSHTRLFHHFQESLGINAAHRATAPDCQAGLQWSQQFLQLCKMNERVGIGAIGIGTELIVANIYNQILDGLKAHSDLTMTQRVFFELHSECDDEHAAQMILIAEDLAQDFKACEQIEYGVHMAVKFRTAFWDEMLERAQSFPASAATANERLSDVGYQTSL